MARILAYPESMLDQDLYKLTMQQAVCQRYPRAHARYNFINRGGTEFPEGLDVELQDSIHIMAGLSLTPEEKKFLKETCPYLTPVYLDFLEGYRFDPSEVMVKQTDGDLSVTVEGPWYRSIMWEVPLLAIISEQYFLMTGQKGLPVDELNERDIEKAKKLSGIIFADFGTRRRFSAKNQNRFIGIMKVHADGFVGTSNVCYAMKHGVKPKGTHAHEWFQFHAALHGFINANLFALDNWVDVYKGDLGIALSDTFTSDNFFDSFDQQHAKLFDGVRHDSGDPFKFAEKAIHHYESLGIDPMAKTIVFSDSINPDLAVGLNDFCKGRIRCSFGIGTNFTNDVGVKPLNMVIKMTGCKIDGRGDWIPTIKLSDVNGKYTGDSEMIRRCKETLGLE